MGSAPRGSLDRYLPQPAATEEDLYRMRQAVWHKQGIVIIRLADVHNDWVRQALINLANQLYGVKDTV